MDIARCTVRRYAAASASSSGRVVVPPRRVAAGRHAILGARRRGVLPGGKRSSAGSAKAKKRGEVAEEEATGLPEALRRGTFDEFVNEDGEPVEEQEPDYNLKYLYDGGCTVCLSLVAMLKSRKGNEMIYFEDISDPNYSARRNAGVAYEDAMDTIHVIKKDGDVIIGMDALTALYAEVGLGWVFKLASLPLLNKVAEIIYKLISKNRLAMGGGMDALMAVGRINMEKEGTGSCEADGECRAKPEPEKKETSSDDEEDTPITGSWMDHEHVLGIYTYGLGEGLRAAPIDANTGKFLVPGYSVRLESHDYDTLVTAIDNLIGRFSWNGAIGLGLPGLLSRRDPTASEWLPEALKSSDLVETSGPDSRKNKQEFEQYLKEACNHDVIVMTGAEACGYAEINYGSARDLDGLVLMITIGQGFGAALFDNKVLVRNVSGVVTDQLSGWSDPEWTDAVCPPSDCDDVAKWDAWGRRVEHFLMKLEEFCHPDCIIVGGSGCRQARSWSKLEPRLSNVKAPMRMGQLGHLAGVKGAAAGAADELVLRDDLAVMRAAIGKFWAKSPSAMNEDDIRRAYDAMDADGDGDLTPVEVADALQGMGVDLPKQELRELVYDIDVDRSGSVSFEEFKEFWISLVSDQAVTLMHTLAEYNNALLEESRSNRLLVLQVGFTYCKPCRRFEPKYHEFAEKYEDGRFLRINGNENSEMVTLGRDILKVRSSPSFYFFRNGEIVYRTSGANEEKIEDAILRNLLPGEAGFVAGYEPKEEFTPAPPQAQPEASKTAA